MTPDKMRERCETCRFWRIRKIPVTLDGMLTGEFFDDPECRRNPPGFHMNDDWSGTAWPSTKADDWCGEYSASQADA